MIKGLRRFFRLDRSDIELELLFHIDARVDDLVKLGTPREQAYALAVAEFGDIKRYHAETARIDRERAREDVVREFLQTLVADVRYAARALIHRPVLLAVTTITLAVGIAANAIMFGVIDQLMLRPPALVVAPDDVKRINYRDVATSGVHIGDGTTYPVLPTLRQGAPEFSEIAAMGSPNDYSLGSGPDARSVKVQLVSANYFRLLGVKPILGLGFNDDHDRVPESDKVAVVSHGFWQQELGGDAHAIGRTLPLQGATFTVVGVAPRGFASLDKRRVDIWIPVASFANTVIGPGWHNTNDNWWARLIGRVRAGGSPELAATQATAAYRGIVREWNETEIRDSTSSIVLSSIIGTRTPKGISQESKISLWLLGVSAIVLLIACANVANLLIARTHERRREISVRLALGVSRARLTRMLLTEVGLLALLGALTALVIAVGASRFVQGVLLPDIVWAESVVDARVFGVTLAVTLLCVLLAGVAPALQGVRTSVTEGLKSSARQVAGGRGGLRFALVMTQAALSVLLLVGAGLFVKSLRNVVTRDVGVDRDRVLQVSMPLRRFGFDTTQIEDIYRRGSERIRTLPGVAGVTVVRLSAPMGSASAHEFSVPGVKQVDLKGGGPYNSIVESGFFTTVGASIVRGRDFTPDEERVPSRVAIVNEMLARAYWPNEDPIGKCVEFGDNVCSPIVGVSKNVFQFFLINDDRALVYVPPSHPAFRGERPSSMLVRLSGDPSAVIPMVRKELQSLAATMPYVTVKPYSELVASQLRPWRLGATMFTLFGAIALVIAAVGLYSVMAYWVSQRTQEIGVRMALGATRGDVVRFVAWQSSRAVIAGLAVGGVLALLATRYIATMLYETSPRDPAVYLGAGAVLALAAVVASVVPARRSAAVDPAQAIRTE